MEKPVAMPPNTVRRMPKGAEFWAKTEKNLMSRNCGSTIVTDKRVIVLIGPQDSKAELLNTLAHEVRHVVDSVATGAAKSPAQITGEIFSTFADWL